MRAHGLGRIDVHELHEPARRIAADGDGRQVEAAVALAGVGEVPGVAGIPGEVDAEGWMAQHPAAPQPAVGVGQRALGPVLNGHEVDVQALVLGALPPVHLHHVGDADARKPRLGAQAGEEARRAAGLAGQRGDAGDVEVVVVVVRDHHGVDVRQLGERRCGGHHAARTDEAEWRGTLAELRVGDHVHAAELEQHAGVADPGHARFAPVGAQPGGVRRSGFEAVALGGPGRQAGAPLFPFPAPEAALLRVRVDIAEARRRAMRLGGVEVGVGDACAGGQRDGDAQERDEA